MSSNSDDIISKPQDDNEIIMMFPNSTAALMATRFKNMKDEDFVFPPKKEASPDDGAVIRAQELLSRQKSSAQNGNGDAPKIDGPGALLSCKRDIVLETLLSKMSDDDFIYPQKKKYDPNEGRIVRALEAASSMKTDVAKNDKAETIRSNPTTDVAQKVVNVSETNPLFELNTDLSREWDLPANPVPYHKKKTQKKSTSSAKPLPANTEIDKATDSLTKLDVKGSASETKKENQVSGDTDKKNNAKTETKNDIENTYYDNISVPDNLLEDGGSGEKKEDGLEGKTDIFDRPTVWNSGPAYPINYLDGPAVTPARGARGGRGGRSYQGNRGGGRGGGRGNHWNQGNYHNNGNQGNQVNNGYHRASREGNNNGLAQYSNKGDYHSSRGGRYFENDNRNGQNRSGQNSRDNSSGYIGERRGSNDNGERRGSNGYNKERRDSDDGDRQYKGYPRNYKSYGSPSHSSAPRGNNNAQYDEERDYRQGTSTGYRGNSRGNYRGNYRGRGGYRGGDYN